MAEGIGKFNTWGGVNDPYEPATIEGKPSADVRAYALVDATGTDMNESTVAATVRGTLPVFARELQVTMGEGNVNAAGDTYQGILLRSGEAGMCLIAAGQNILAKYTPLSSNGDGTLKIAAVDGTEEILAHAIEVANYTAVTAIKCLRG